MFIYIGHEDVHVWAMIQGGLSLALAFSRNHLQGIIPQEFQEDRFLNAHGIYE